MMHYREKVIMKAGQIASIPVKEFTREVDVEEEESDYVISKFKYRANLVDKMTRINIKKIPLLESAMKYYYGCNHYGKRDKVTNVGASTDECPRFNEIETWKHVVQYSKTVSMRAEFILKLHEGLKKVQGPGVTDEYLRKLIEDIMKFMREDLDDFEKNSK